MKKSKRTASIRHILSPSGNPFYTYYISFRSSGSQESNALNNVWIKSETKNLWPFEDNRTKLSENFASCLAAVKPPVSTCVPLRKFKFQFCSYESSCEIISNSWNHLQVAKSQIQLAKWTILTWEIFTSYIWTCEIHLCNLIYLRPTQLDFLLLPKKCYFAPLIHYVISTFV